MIFQYRSDIDGLRAVAIVPVIFFHAGNEVVSGGYIGVDIFFVISGYLITSLIYKEITEGTFTFLGFYKRRAARLLPALALLFFSVLIFGGIFYNNRAFDNLGKEIFFSSIGAANILFAQGVNYFADEDFYRPLLHLWSLGVEEQFYLIWPAVLCATIFASKKLVLPVATLAFVVSLLLSIDAVDSELSKGYFLLHYRAFELLVGAITALLLARGITANLKDGFKQLISLLGMLLMVIPMFTMDKHTQFPGYNALWPCIGAAMVIATPIDGPISRILSTRIFVFIGLISYPMYLYHQPIISFVKFFDLQLSSLELFLIIASLTLVASWLTYRFVELPIRRRAKSKHRKKSVLTVALLVATVPVFAGTGLIIAKTGGLQERYQYLNPYALEISKAHLGSFALHFKRGYKVSSNNKSKVLFVGDSLMQHYIYSFQKALGVSRDEIDTVTRGGCVLLKGTDFVDRYSDISCDGLKSRLFESEKTYEFVVISQSWTAYDSAVTNFPTSDQGFKKWQLFLDSTIDHFLSRSKYIIIIGAHPKLTGTNSIQPSLTMTEESYSSGLKNLKVENKGELESSFEFFNSYRGDSRIVVIDPYTIFCQEKCVLSDEVYSYFYNRQHLSNHATEFVSARLEHILSSEFD